MPRSSYEAAFPFSGYVDPRNGTLPDGDNFIEGQPGMSLRDYFAGQALVGCLASKEWHEAIDALTTDGNRGVAIMAGAAYGIADAMLKAREAS